MSLGSIHSFAQTGSDSLILQGAVTSFCIVNINPEPVATNLDIIGAGHSGTRVAAIQVYSNATALATSIGISDDTNGLLENQSDTSYNIPYTLDYSSTDTGNTVNGYSPTTTPTQLDFQIGPGGFNGVLDINLTANPALPAGDYQANVTVECTII